MNLIIKIRELFGATSEATNSSPPTTMPDLKSQETLTDQLRKKAQQVITNSTSDIFDDEFDDQLMTHIHQAASSGLFSTRLNRSDILIMINQEYQTIAIRNYNDILNILVEYIKHQKKLECRIAPSFGCSGLIISWGNERS